MTSLLHGTAMYISYHTFHQYTHTLHRAPGGTHAYTHPDTTRTQHTNRHTQLLQNKNKTNKKRGGGGACTLMYYIIEFDLILLTKEKT